MLSTLRVIVVRTDERSGAKVIERNRFYYANSFPDKRVSDLKVKSGERKTIYLIANEAGTGIDLSDRLRRRSVVCRHSGDDDFRHAVGRCF